jgi:hypothetical protein
MSTINRRVTPSVVHATRHGWGYVQGIVGLFAAGAFYEFHKWFLMQHAAEFYNLTTRFGMRCSIKARIEGSSTGFFSDDCIGLQSYTPQFQLYMMHLPEVLAFATTMLLGLTIFAFIWRRRQRKSPSQEVSVQQPHGRALDDGMI